ncbi:MAG TPA: alpha/beta fold hydrolase [bacterium]
MNILFTNLAFLILFASLLCAQTEKPVTFQRDNLQLVGVLHVPEKSQAKSPAVLMLHGFTGHKSETHFIYTQLARDLAENGIVALRFDFAGSGDSQGEFADMTILSELEDAKAALEFLRKQEGIDAANTGLLGFSLGGCVAALLAGDRPTLKAMVLWAPVAYPQENFRDLPDRFPEKQMGKKTIHDMNGFYVGKLFFDQLLEIKPLQAIEKFSSPTLIIHGDADSSVPPAASWAYGDILRKNDPRSQLEIIPGAGHTFANLEHTNRVISLTTSWFKKYLFQRN